MQNTSAMIKGMETLTGKDTITVLCIDDEYIVRKSISTFLERKGFKVLQAENGRVGLKIFHDFNPDIVLVDIKMPEMNGLEVLENIKRNSPQVPVIIISGAGVMNTAIEAIRLGAWDFITKPIFDPAILEHTIRRELERASMVRELKIYQEHLEDEIIRRTNEVYKELKEKMAAEERLKKSLNDLQQIMSGTIEAFGRMAEVRDPYTAGHQKKVTQLACAIGRKMGLNDDMCKSIEVAGSLHDIGKIYIPSEILNKPGALTTLEVSLIKTHPQVGYDIIKTVPFPWVVARVIKQHHERLDGSGYPDGIKHDEICLQARIIGVADVVEAMSSHRPYRPALGMEIALKEINEGRNIIYDKDVVSICTALIRNGEFSF
jgi:putative two-component system response regulator